MFCVILDLYFNVYIFSMFEYFYILENVDIYIFSILRFCVL